MKKAYIVIFISCLLLANITVSALANTVTVSNEVPGNAFIPKGTLIEAELITGVNSGDNGVHDIAYFRIKQNVLVDGVVVLRSGTVGNAYVTGAESASYLGKSGKIELKINNIQAINGAIVPLTLDIKKYGGAIDKDLPFQLLALYSVGVHKLGHLYTGFRGAEAEIPVGTKFQVAVDYDADLGCTPDRLISVMMK